MQYAITDKPEHKDFSVERAMTTDFPETGFQPLYFIVESLESLQTQMRLVSLDYIATARTGCITSYS